MADITPSGRFTSAARRVLWHEDPVVLAYHPVARMNPYQSLLYCRGSAAGIAVAGVRALKDLEALPVVRELGATPVVHLHWTSEVLGQATTAEDGEQRLNQFRQQFSDLRSRGVRLVWTVHNRMPHRCPHPDLEVRLRRFLAEFADVIHIMAESTPRDVADLYELPRDRLLLVPHPSYAGAYPTHHDRELIRWEHGWEVDDFVVGTVGSIQPYKGMEGLLEAAADLRADVPRLRVLLAGMPSRDQDSRELVARLSREPGVQLLPHRLDDQELAQAVAALDVMALPYRAPLNSGAALLALSLGVPVLAPRAGHFVELENQGLCLAYAPEAPSGLRDALRAAPDWVRGVDPRHVARYVEDRAAAQVSDEFFHGVRQWVQRRRSRP